MDATAGSELTAKKARTYMVPEDSQMEIIDFAEFMRDLEAYLRTSRSKAALVDPDGTHHPIPDEVFRALEQVANALASGNGVTVAPYGMLMTTQQAADFLGISRPTLVKLLVAGDIEHEMRGRHRRVKLRALVDYQERFRMERRGALEDLARSSASAKVQVGDPAALKRLSE